MIKKASKKVQNREGEEGVNLFGSGEKIELNGMTENHSLKQREKDGKRESG